FYLGPEALGVAAFGLLVDCIVALDSNAAAEQLAGIGHGTRAACYPKTRLLRGGAVAAAERKRLIIRDLWAAGNRSEERRVGKEWRARGAASWWQKRGNRV